MSCHHRLTESNSYTRVLQMSLLHIWSNSISLLPSVCHDHTRDIWGVYPNLRNESSFPLFKSLSLEYYTPFSFLILSIPYPLSCAPSLYIIRMVGLSESMNGLVPDALLNVPFFLPILQNAHKMTSYTNNASSLYTNARLTPLVLMHTFSNGTQNVPPLYMTVGFCHDGVPEFEKGIIFLLRVCVWWVFW